MKSKSAFFGIFSLCAAATLILFQNCAPTSAGHQSTGSASALNQVSTTPGICPIHSPPACSGGTYSKVKDSAGCESFVCVAQKNPLCPIHNIPACRPGEGLVVKIDAQNCTDSVCGKTAPCPIYEQPLCPDGIVETQVDPIGSCQRPICILKTPPVCPDHLVPTCQPGVELLQMATATNGCPAPTCVKVVIPPGCRDLPMALPACRDGGAVVPFPNELGCLTPVCVGKIPPGACPMPPPIAPACQTDETSLPVSNGLGCPVAICVKRTVGLVCPALAQIPPACAAGQVITTVLDKFGCSTSACVKKPVGLVCPALAQIPPVCAAGQVATTVLDRFGCSTSVCLKKTAPPIPQPGPALHP